MNIYIETFKTFLKGGGLAFGNGYAAITPIRDSIMNHQWLSEEAFEDTIVIAQALPGLFSLNFAVFLGYKIKGWRGSLAALSGMLLPALALAFILAVSFNKVRDLPIINSFLKGARPAIIALMVYPCFKLFKRSNNSLSTIWLPIGALLAIYLLHISPAYIIMVVVACAIVYSLLIKP